LSNIIDYFGKVYTPKRSLNAHRQEVDHFVQRKDESLEITMLRCLVAIDRLKIIYLPSAWPKARINLRRNILTQIITEDTRRYIQLEEDDILEKHGLLKLPIASSPEDNFSTPLRTNITLTLSTLTFTMTEAEPSKTSLKSKFKDLTKTFAYGHSLDQSTSQQTATKSEVNFEVPFSAEREAKIDAQRARAAVDFPNPIDETIKGLSYPTIEQNEQWYDIPPKIDADKNKELATKELIRTLREAFLNTYLIEEDAFSKGVSVKDLEVNFNQTLGAGANSTKFK
jgi:hypothetical protein